ncbi:hypothetical protein BB560_000180 [Smittium megazygosporum]|uniref:V-type proton ATPase subunit E n=1 Tax=Smittium megazygosporum TaxID=133381 RepID=A0A2T9ZL20_9FUNG|nr:hypothetical protein BB560_000180 [Smittium megazygosporum]
MSLNRPLNDDEVFTEMKKMVAFIKQEALEKAREIRAKADEEFNIEKAKIVRQEAVNIEKQYERKVKILESNKRIATSNMINKSRLQLLKKRQEILDQIFDQAFESILDHTKDPNKYKVLLTELCVQAFEKLVENDVVVQTTERDSEIVASILDDAKRKYLEDTGASINVSLDTKNFLSNDCGGGVVVVTRSNNIQVENTLRARLNICSQELLPVIRVTILGHSPNRKFFD